jgi:hypothetical protein
MNALVFQERQVFTTQQTISISFGYVLLKAEQMDNTCG